MIEQKSEAINKFSFRAKLRACLGIRKLFGETCQSRVKAEGESREAVGVGRKTGRTSKDLWGFHCPRTGGRTSEALAGFSRRWNKQSGAAPHVNEYLFSGTNQGLSIVLLKLLVAQTRHSSGPNDRDSASQFKELEAQIADFVLVFQMKFMVFEGQKILIIQSKTDCFFQVSFNSSCGWSKSAFSSDLNKEQLSTRSRFKLTNSTAILQAPALKFQPTTSIAQKYSQINFPFSLHIISEWISQLSSLAKPPSIPSTKQSQFPSCKQRPMARAQPRQTASAPVFHPQPQLKYPQLADPLADEIALYDRQIRLWGMKAQERIRNANILLITMKALANEIAKNLVLAGIGSITILDPDPVTEADLGAQFFLSEEDTPVGTNRAAAASAAIQRLNPRVRVHIDTTDIRVKPPSFYAPFDIIIATDLDSPTLNLINTATRLNSRPFYAAGSHGMYGFLFADLIEHDFVISRSKSNIPTPLGPETRTRSILSVVPKPGDEATTELVTKRELYSTWLLASDASSLPAEILRSPRRRKVVTPVLSCLRALWSFPSHSPTASPIPSKDSHADLALFTRLCGEQHKALGLPAETLRSEVLRAFLQNVGAEVAPVAAVLGGQLAQDVINVLGQTQQPVQNFVVFDGEAMEAGVYALHPEGALGRALLPLSGPGLDLGVGVEGMPAGEKGVWHGAVAPVS